MQYRSITCSSLVNKITKKDTLFIGNYTLDPYQNCEFGCLYCDSLTDKTVYIKSNATKLFEKEIKRLKKGIIIVGSVHDPYQKAEEIYKITRDILKIIKKYNFTCHILTKSNLILRDLDLLSGIDNCMITVSITTLDKSVSNIFEKEVLPSEERLNVVKTLSEAEIKTGIAIMPVMPYIVETELEDMVKSACKHKAGYVVHKYLELKGDQKLSFLKIIEDSYPHLLIKYKELYGDNPTPNSKYISELNAKISKYCQKYEISNKI